MRAALSNPLADRHGSELSTNARRFGLVVLPRGFTWSILDKYTVGDKTQVLRCPYKEVGEYSMESVIQAARDDFEDLSEANPAANLDTDEWRKRLFFPVGLTDEGVLVCHHL